MTEIEPDASLPTEAGGTDITRFNALKHGILSRYTVLPWEDADEYGALLEALAAEHSPQGPTEEHLVEELAGILWRKRRLRLAEASAMREGLHRATRSYSDAGEAALVCISGGDGDVGEALRATPEETEQDLRENREAREAADKPWLYCGRVRMMPMKTLSGRCAPARGTGGSKQLRSGPRSPSPNMRPASRAYLDGWKRRQSHISASKSPS